MVTVDSYTASIYIGTRENYDGEPQSLDIGRAWLHAHVDAIGLAVTLTQTEFIYRNGDEPGFIVGLINYPRYPSTPPEIRRKALYIAESLKTIYKQQRVSVVFPDETIMLGNS